MSKILLGDFVELIVFIGLFVSAAFCMTDWCAHFENAPIGYEPKMAWPWPVIGFFGCALLAISALFCSVDTKK